MTGSAPPPMTAAELERYPVPNKQTELLRGKLVVREPPGTLHGLISGTLTLFLGDYVRRNGLGMVCGQDTGFKIESNPDTVRAPDVAFISRNRLAQIPPRGYAPLAPDLVAEILSPDDRPAEVLAKVADWLEAGTRLVWVIDPAVPEARIYRGDGTLSLVGANGMLEGEGTIPGFSCTLAEITRVG